MNILFDIKRQLIESSDIFRSMVEHCLADFQEASRIMIEAVKSGKKILWCGNGGSAAQAQHFSTELVGGLRDHGRPAIPSISLTTDSSLLTAWSNDTSFETVFSRQIEALGESGDVLIALSTSGNSKNIIAAVKLACKKELAVITLTGHTGGKLNNLGNVTLKIPSLDTQRTQEGHLIAGHILCELVEQAVSKGDN